MLNNGEAVPASEEAAATFPADMKLIKEGDYTIQSKLSVAMKPGSSGRRCPIKPTFIKVQRRHLGVEGQINSGAAQQHCRT